MWKRCPQSLLRFWGFGRHKWYHLWSLYADIMVRNMLKILVFMFPLFIYQNNKFENMRQPQGLRCFGDCGSYLPAMGQPISTLLPDKGLYIESRLAGNPSLVCNMFLSILTKPKQGKSSMFLLVMMDVSALATSEEVLNTIMLMICLWFTTFVFIVSLKAKTSSNKQSLQRLLWWW